MSRHRTPLRYPGGKQRLAPFVTELLVCNKAVGWNYVEPYAGGAGVAMELLLDQRVSHVYLNDSSVHVYSFWKAMLSDPDEFCSRISRSSLSINEWKTHRELVRHPKDHGVMDLGFSTFYLNRCNRSGILTAGVIGGLAQEGKWRIDARFPRNALISRIETIAARSAQITVTNLDAEIFMIKKVNALPPNTLVYCDPPYYERAERLYLNTYTHDDHIRLSRVVQRQLRRPWLVSYDGHPSIIAMYSRRRKFEYALHYSATASYSGREVFIFSDGLRIPSTSRLGYVRQGLSHLSSSREMPA
jgi:DNA adenine methylase